MWPFDYFRRKEEKQINNTSEHELKYTAYPEEVAISDRKTGEWNRFSLNRNGKIQKIKLTNAHLKRVETQRKLTHEFYKKAEPIITNLIEKDKKKFDGFKYYTNTLTYEGGKMAHKLILRPDGNFNIEYTSTDFGEYWPGSKDDNKGKGYNPKELGRQMFKYYRENQGHVRHELIGEIKKRTGIDLRKELKEKKDEKSLESRVYLIIGIVGFLVGIFFLSSNLTGNVIGILNQKSSNWIGLILFLIGLIGVFFYFNRK